MSARERLRMAYDEPDSDDDYDQDDEDDEEDEDEGDEEDDEETWQVSARLPSRVDTCRPASLTFQG